MVVLSLEHNTCLCKVISTKETINLPLDLFPTGLAYTGQD